MDNPNASEWHYETYAKHQRIQQALLRSVPSNLPKNPPTTNTTSPLPVLRTSIPNYPACKVIHVDDALLENQACKELTKITLSMYKDNGVKGTVDPDPDEDPDHNNEWICRQDTSLKYQPTYGNTTSGEMLIRRIKKKFEDAMELIVGKMEKGLLPTSWERQCDPEFQYGIDKTPTPSMCGGYPSPIGSMINNLANTETQQSFIHEKSTEDLVDEISNYLSETPAYCPINDLNIDEYLQEPHAEYLLKTVGALDENGLLLCTYSDFYQVEHAVKSVLVELAKTCIDDYMKTTVASALTPTKSDIGLNQTFENRMEMRAKLKETIHDELEQCCPSFLKKKEEYTNRFSRHTPMYRNSNAPKRGQQSAARELMSEEIAGKILTSIDRGLNLDDNQQLDLDNDVKDDDELIEIMLFPDRDSFATDNDTIIPTPEQKRQSKMVHLDGPVRAEFKSWTLRYKPDVCFTELDYTKPRSLREWQNLTELNQLTISDVEIEARKHFLELKYCRHWILVTRKRHATRSYSSEDGQDQPREMWRGPFPPYVLMNIRALKGMSNFEPDSSKSFYKGVRKLEANMFEQARLMLKNADQDDQ